MAMNGIHVAAAVVRLANLLSGPSGGRDARSSHGLMVDEAEAQLLLDKLCRMYVDFCRLGAYPGARQHANVAWAVGKIVCLRLPPGLVDHLVQQVRVMHYSW